MNYRRTESTKRKDYMDFEKWEPLYLKMLNRFGFTREKDEKAALWMSE